MSRLLITPQEVLGSYPNLPLIADSADIIWTAAGVDFIDGFRFPLTGRELLIIRNNTGVQTVTLSSVVSARTNRKGDITAYSMAAADVLVFGPFINDGWQQVSGELWGAVTVADVDIAVLKW